MSVVLNVVHRATIVENVAAALQADGAGDELQRRATLRVLQALDMVEPSDDLPELDEQHKEEVSDAGGGRQRRSASSRFGPFLVSEWPALRAVPLGNLGCEAAAPSHEAADLKEKVEALRAFWRSAVQTGSPLTTEDADEVFYFISHTWTAFPWSGSRVDMDEHAMEKAQILHLFAVHGEALEGDFRIVQAGPTGSVSEKSHDLLPPTFRAHKRSSWLCQMPLELWVNRKCWVDKASSSVEPDVASVPESGTLNSQESIHLAKHALGQSKQLLVIWTGNYFSRLWCVFEFATFIARVAPHYRCAELVIPGRMFEEKTWAALVGSVESFSLNALRTGSENDHAELWQELERLLVSSRGFERFIKAVVLALMARRALLDCGRRCLAFGTEHGGSAFPMREVQACATRLGFTQLAKVLHAAKPSAWFHVAIGGAKRERETGGLSEAQEDADQDPLTRLWRAIGAKLEADDRAKSRRLPTAREAAEYAATHEGADHRDEELAQLLKRGQEALTEGTEKVLVQLDQDSEAAVQEIRDAVVSDEAEAEGMTAAASTDLAEPEVGVHESEKDDDEVLNRGGTSRAPSKGWGSAAYEESRKKDAHIGAKVFMQGVPLGFFEFWRAKKGHDLTEVEANHAEVFHAAWKKYKTKVDRWFDALVVPQLELFRQAALRNPGALEEALRAGFVPLAGATQSTLCDRLAPGLREHALAREQPPRGRRDRPPEAPWWNPTLDRLLVVTTFDKGDTANTRPGIISTPLSVTLAEPPQSIAFCVRPVGSRTWSRVSLPKRLGVEALMTAFKHLTSAGAARGVDVEVLVPQVALEVPGTGVRTVLGSFACGRLMPRELASSKDSAQRSTAKRGSVICSKSPHSMDLSMKGTSSIVLAKSEELAEELDEQGACWRRWLRVEPGEGGYSAALRALGENQTKQQQASARKGKLQPIDVGELTYEAAVERLRTESLDAHAVNRNAAPVAGGWKVTPRRGPGAAQDSPLPLSLPQTANPRNGGPGGLLPSTVQPIAPRLPLLHHCRGQAGASPRSSPKSHSARGPRERLPEMRGAAAVTATAPATTTMPAGTAALAAITTTAPPAVLPQELLARRSIFERLSLVGSPTTQPSLALGDGSASLVGLSLEGRAEWALRAFSGLSPEDRSWRGNLREIFEQCIRWYRGAGFAHWVPLDAMAIARAEPGAVELAVVGDPGNKSAALRRRSAARSLLSSNNDLSKLEIGSPLARALPCLVCQHTDIAQLSLEGSMLQHLWDTRACRICLRCGFVEPRTPANEGKFAHQASALQGDIVLEVSSSISISPGAASIMQRLASRVLRVEGGQILVAAPGDSGDGAPTAAKSRVGYVSFATRSAGLCAAVGMAHVHRTLRRGDPELCQGHFMEDHDWVYTCLAETGLDLMYGEARSITVEVALEELDDLRMLPRRQNMQPLVLFAELQHVLSSNFDMTEWIQAVVKVVGSGIFSLPAALLLRRNIVRLRKLLHVRRPRSPGASQPAGADVGLQMVLHRVLVAREQDVEGVLGAGLARLGVDAAGPKELMERGTAALRAKLGDWQPAVVGNDASGILRALALRTQGMAWSSEAASRLRLQARRVLRKHEVARKLDGLHRRYTSEIIEEADNESSSEEDEELMDEVISASESEDGETSQRKSSSRASRKTVRQKKDSLEELTLILQRIIGNAQEYVHVGEVIYKALHVLFIIVTTFKRFYQAMDYVAGSNVDIMIRRKKDRRCTKRKTVTGGGDQEQISRLWQVILDQGFIRIAVRALYRHASRPHVGGIALAILELLLNEGSDGEVLQLGEPYEVRSSVAQYAVKELASPPERVLTLINAAGKFVEGGHTAELALALEVLVRIIPVGEEVPLPQLPRGRELEAATALIGIFHRHATDEHIYLPTLHLLIAFRRSKVMAMSLYSAGLTKTLREWLMRSTVGEVQAAWNRAVAGEGVMVGVSGRGVKALREATSASAALRDRLLRCEVRAWDLLCGLTIEFAGRLPTRQGRRTSALGGPRGSEAPQAAELDLKTEIKDLAANSAVIQDAKATVALALSEVSKIQRTSQWQPATRCLTALLDFNLEMLGGAVLESKECFNMLLSEVQGPDVAITLPLLQAALGANCRAQDAEFVLGEEESTGVHRQTEESGGDAATKYSDRMEDLLRTVAAAAQNVVAKQNGMRPLMSTVDKLTDFPELQAMLLRTISSVISGATECQTTMISDFYEHAKNSAVEDERKGRGAGCILSALRKHMSTEEVVDPAMQILTRMLDLDKEFAEFLAGTEDAITCCIDVVWKHLSSTGSRNPRCRALRALRQIHDARPELVVKMVKVWDARKASRDDRVKAHLEVAGQQERAAFMNLVKAASAPESEAAASAAPDQAASLDAVDVSAVKPGEGELQDDLEIDHGWPRGLPGEVLYFGAFIHMKLFQHTKGQSPLRDVSDALLNHAEDREISVGALVGLLQCVPEHMTDLMGQLVAIPNVLGQLKKMLRRFQEQEVAVLCVKTLTKMLCLQLSDLREQVEEVAAVAVSQAIGHTNEYTAEIWEALLEAIDALVGRGGTDTGKRIAARLDILSRMEEIWEGLLAKVDPVARMLVKAYREDTELILKR